MFESFYSLKENPFNITADPSFYFASQQHHEAITNLKYGIASHKGIMALTGEVGTGKTTLCRLLLNEVPQNVITAFIINPNFSQLQLLQLIAQDLGIKEVLTNKLTLINALNEFLLKAASKNFTVAVIIDEAQNLGPAQLEQIRLLSNLETEKTKLLQIILVGQPELHNILQQESLRQINQRIAIRYRINNLTEQENIDYIYHRLNVAGATKQLIFDSEALNAIFTYSQGIPRITNIICERTLLAGFTAETFQITKDIVDRCASELGFTMSQGVAV